MTTPDAPKTLAAHEAREERLRALYAPHIAPLSGFVESLRRRVGPEYHVPYFDPWDGGIGADCLFLLEAPGPNAVKSGFISRNNPDESAKNFFLANQEAGIPRSRAVIWNIVPWYVGSGAKVRPVTKGDIREALPYLLELLALLPNLRAAVLVGQKALAGRESVEQWQPKIKVFGSPHPSPMFVNRKPGNRVRLLAGLSEVARYIHGSGSDTSTRAAGGLQKA